MNNYWYCVMPVLLAGFVGMMLDAGAGWTSPPLFWFVGTLGGMLTGYRLANHYA